jgi:CheY-like chemotaxis protein
VVLRDIAMPQMSGHEAYVWMRREAPGRDIRMVALSMWGLAEDRSRSSEAGFDRHVVKPMDRSRVLWVAGSHGPIRGNP